MMKHEFNEQEKRVSEKTKRQSQVHRWLEPKGSVLDCLPGVKLPDRHPFDPQFDQAVDVKLHLGLMNGLQARADGGVRRDKEAAAVLIGLDRDRIGPDLLGDGDDFIFVEADERTKDRQLIGFNKDEIIAVAQEI